MSAYGVYRMFIIYTISGIIGFYLSYIAGVRVTIGASASICGLIGAALYYGKTRNNVWGQAIFKQTSGWVVSIAVFGLAVPDINNWGHGGGLVAGIVSGWLMGYENHNSTPRVFYFLGFFLCVATTFLLLGWRLIYAVTLRLL